MVNGKGFHNNTADTLTITWKAANPLSPTRAWFSIPDNVALISVRYFILMTHILPPLHVLSKSETTSSTPYERDHDIQNKYVAGRVAQCSTSRSTFVKHHADTNTYFHDSYCARLWKQWGDFVLWKYSVLGYKRKLGNISTRKPSEGNFVLIMWPKWVYI